MLCEFICTCLFISEECSGHFFSFWTHKLHRIGCEKVSGGAAVRRSFAEDFQLRLFLGWACMLVPQVTATARTRALIGDSKPPSAWVMERWLKHLSQWWMWMWWIDGWMGGRKKITQKDSSLLNDVVCWRLLSRKAQYFAIKWTFYLAELNYKFLNRKQNKIRNPSSFGVR